MPLLWLCLVAPGAYAAARPGPAAGVEEARLLFARVSLPMESRAAADARARPAGPGYPLLRFRALHIHAMDVTPVSGSGAPPPLPAGIHMNLLSMLTTLAGGDAPAPSYALRLRLPF